MSTLKYLGIAAASGLGVYLLSRDRSGRTGYVDLYRTKDGEATKYPKPVRNVVKVKHGDPKFPELDKMLGSKDIEGESWASVGGGPLLTSTKKMATSSWSLRGGKTCPAVQFDVAQALQDLGKERVEDLSDTEILEKLRDKVPQKCWACYATFGNYQNNETKRAQEERFRWFEETPDDEVVEVLTDAIRHAGSEQCKMYKRDGWYDTKCTYDPNATPKYFRLFDAGDFHSARAVEIWEKVIKRFPDTKFWLPTTVWSKSKCYPEAARIMKGLKRIARFKNVNIRPSALQVDEAAPVFHAAGRKFNGSAVIAADTKTGEAEFDPKKIRVREDTKWHPYKLEVGNVGPGKGGFTIPRYVDIKDSKGKWVEHYVCPGNCHLCRRCWDTPEKKANRPVAYVAHGLKPTEKNLVRLVRWSGEGADYSEILKRSKEEIGKLLVTNDRIGPSRETELSWETWDGKVKKRPKTKKRVVKVA